MSGGTTSLSSAVTLSGPGTLQVSGGTLAVAGAVSYGNFSLGNGTLAGTGTLFSTGTTTIGVSPPAPQSVATIDGALTTQGQATLQAFNLNLNGLLTNAAGATFYAMSDTYQLASNVNGSGTFINAGSFVENAGQGTVYINTAFNNSGNVSVQSGTLELLGTGVHSGSFAVSSAHTLWLGGSQYLGSTASLVNSGIVNVGPGITAFAAGSRVSGNGALQVVGGRLEVGTAVATGSFSVNSNYAPNNGVLQVGLAGPVPGLGYGTINASGTAHFSGTLDLSFEGGYQPAAGTVFTIASYTQETGLFATVAETGAPAADTFLTTYGPNALTVTVESAPVPLPGSSGLLASAAAPLALLGRRRRSKGAARPRAYLVGSLTFVCKPSGRTQQDRRVKTPVIRAYAAMIEDPATPRAVQDWSVVGPHGSAVPRAHGA